MKRKKWSEQEEQTLISKYSELLRSGSLAKLKTREKKFKPVADHVNAVHHHRDPTTFPFTWSWRDVSIKVQNMRHQYLGVKQKIKSLSPHSFNWNDGLNHWENFLHYKEVFGDIPSKPQQQQQQQNSNHNNNDDSLRNLGFSSGDDDDDDGDGDDDEEEEEELDEECENEVDLVGEVGGRVLELREAVVKREERRREREERREKEVVARERRRVREEGELDLEVELEERRLRWARREVLRRGRLERELEEERRRRKRAEERMEEEEMEWRERMVAMQVEHEKQMMQMHVDACQSNMQILGIMARILCQFFGGAGSDALGGGGGGGGGGSGLGPLPPQVLQNLQHAGELGNVKPDANSPSEFI